MPRKTPRLLNRFWLIVVGVLLVIAGLLGLGIASGEFTPTVFGARVASIAPSASHRVFGAAHVTNLLQPIWQAVLVSVVAIIVGLLGLAWLIAQLPKPSKSPHLQLHDDARNGTTTIAATTIADALETRLASLEGVANTKINISGTADHPDVAARLTVIPHTQIPELLTQARNLVTTDLATALETSPDRLTIQIVDIAPERTSNRHMVV
jgi:hypothetical protein